MFKPNWNEIAKKIDDNANAESLDRQWQQHCRTWLETLSEQLNSKYEIYETDNFSILSSENERYNQLFSAFLERTLKRILSTLKGIASDDGYGKHVAIIFSDIDEYYNYISLYYPEEGEYGLSAGVFINEGYGHFAFPTQEINIAEPIAVHELTHACLSHLPIPTWLNEGLAVTMESALANVNHLYIDNTLIAKHHNYWNTEKIQQFWSGDSFQAIDEGQELSYHLAHILVSNISKDFAVFREFANHANLQDGGEASAITNLGISLGELVGELLGESEAWAPRLLS